MKKYLSLALVLTLVLMSCGKKTEEEMAVVELQGISLSKKSLSMEIGDKKNLIVIYNPEEAAKFAPAVTWESSNSSVATVENGKVVAKHKGKATISAYCGKFFADCPVEVETPKINPDPVPDPQINFSLSPTTIETPASGGEYTVKVTSDTPWKAECEKEWASLSVTEGEGDASLTVKVEPTDVDVESSQRIVFSAGKGKYYVVITRKAKANKLTLDQTEINVPVAGGTFTVKITSENESWDATCYDKDVSITKSGNTATIKIDANTGFLYEKPTTISSKVYFSDGELKTTLNLMREYPYATIDGTTYFKQKSMAANTYKMNLKTNIPWALSLTYDMKESEWSGNLYESAVDNFVSVSPKSGSGDKEITAVVTPRYPYTDAPFARGRARLFVSGTGKWAELNHQLATFEFEAN